MGRENHAVRPAGDGVRHPLVVLLGALLALLAAASARSAPAAAADTAATATVVDLDGAIDPAMSHYVLDAMATAATRGSRVIVLRLDTPGGLDTSMREIIKAILASPVPVIGYVAPSGARAASAGTYILYACHLAAMAPATNLGAATPISLSGGGSSATPATPANAEERKVLNDAVAYIRSLAQLRGRNADWAEAAVRRAASLPAQEALDQHVVNLIADDVPALLQQINGLRVQVRDHPVVLHTAGLTVVHVTPDWRTGVLLFLSHPTIAYGLLLAGIWGLLIEALHPGAVLPGVAGALSLLLALYGLELLAVNFAGLALMALGVGLIITEFFMPTYGSLGVGGLAAFVIGSIILFDHNRTGLQVALPLITGVAIGGALVIAAIVALAARARRRPVTTGAEAMVGELVEVVSGPADQCLVRYGGELWSAHAPRTLQPGEHARIVRVSDLTLWIEPLSSPSPSVIGSRSAS